MLATLKITNNPAIPIMANMGENVFSASCSVRLLILQITHEKQPGEGCSYDESS